MSIVRTLLYRGATVLYCVGHEPQGPTAYGITESYVFFFEPMC